MRRKEVREQKGRCVHLLSRTEARHGKKEKKIKFVMIESSLSRSPPSDKLAAFRVLLSPTIDH